MIEIGSNFLKERVTALAGEGGRQTRVRKHARIAGRQARPRPKRRSRMEEEEEEEEEDDDDEKALFPASSHASYFLSLPRSPEIGIHCCY